MANCIPKNDDLVIVTNITNYKDIRIDRCKNGWEATPRKAEGMGRGWAPTRCGAVSKYLEEALGNTEPAQAIYHEVAVAIQKQFREVS